MKKENKKNLKNNNQKKLFSLPSHQTMYLKKTAKDKGITQSEVIKRLLDKEIESSCQT